MTADPLPLPGLRIGLIDDLFRCEANGMSSFPINMLWLEGALSPAVRHLGGSLTRIASHRFGHRAVDIAPALKALGLSPGREAWLRILDGADAAAVAPWLAGYLDGIDLVIGFELPNVLFDALASLEIPAIDLGFSQIRFLPDLCFDARATHPRLADHLRALHIGEAETLRGVAQIVGAVRRRWGGIEIAGALGRAGVLLGQSRVDASLAGPGGHLAQIGDYGDRIAAWAQGFDSVILKPHPYDPQDIALEGLFDAGVNLVRSPTSPYQLFSYDNVAGAAAISSGSLEEAGWFGVDATRFLTPPRLRHRPNAVDRVSSAVLTAPFLQSLVDGAPLADEPPRLPSLRQQVQVDWGYDPVVGDPQFKPVRRSRFRRGRSRH